MHLYGSQEIKIKEPIDSEELVELLAEVEHDRWSRWEKYRTRMSNVVHASGELNAARWKRQSETPYQNLSEEEKESDRKEARRSLAVINKFISQY